MTLDAKAKMQLKPLSVFAWSNLGTNLVLVVERLVFLFFRHPGQAISFAPDSNLRQAKQGKALPIKRVTLCSCDFEWDGSECEKRQMQ